MTVVTLPYTFTGGTTAVAAQVDADFNALVSAFTGVPTMVQAPTTFYVGPGGADVAGNGLASTSPAATVNYIINLIRANYNLNSQQAIIQLLNGSYTEQLQIQGAMPGQHTAGQLVLQGNVASPNLVTWSADVCVNLANGALLTVTGITMSSTVSSCMISQESSRLLYTTMVFGTVVDSHLIAARGGRIESRGNYTISGGGGTHCKALEGGELFIDPAPGNFMTYGTSVGSPVITLTGTPNFATFANCNNVSTMRIAAAFSGTATGNQGHVGYNGSLNIVGQGTSYLPGTANTVTVVTGGVYG